MENIKCTTEGSVESISDSKSITISNIGTCNPIRISVPNETKARIINDFGKQTIIIEPINLKKERRKFKDGDILVSNHKDGTCFYIIFKKYEEEYNRTYYHFMINPRGYVLTDGWCQTDDFKPVTESQRRYVNSNMFSNGYLFDYDNRNLCKINNGDVICIDTIYSKHFISMVKNLYLKRVEDYYSLNYEGKIIRNNEGICKTKDIVMIRFAIEEEKKYLLKTIENSEYKKWDEKTKKFINIKYRAANGSNYFYVDDLGHVCMDVESNSINDIQRYESCNYFETEDICKEACSKSREIYSKL